MLIEKQEITFTTQIHLVLKFSKNICSFDTHEVIIVTFMNI